MEEKGIDPTTGAVVVAIDARYFRPTEVDLLLGDPTKARLKLGWTHTSTLEQLVAEMMEGDRALIRDGRF